MANRQASATHYRADIDGLRALAVLPVVFYHYDIAPFGGGFVGVDIFFVISGFLITSLIHSQMDEGRFSILNFYERRIRRLFPALFAMLGVSAVAALLLLFPDDLVRFAKSFLATAAFASNLQFWSEAGYFDAAASQKPLLHTWSLAVEEQFYLIFPTILYLLRRAGRAGLVTALGALLAVSLALSIWGVYYAPVSAFYLLPYRFWELMLGAVLAAGRFAVPGNAIARNAISLVGLALIAWGVFALNSASPFPGLNAVPPCLGAALIIYAGSGPRTTVNALLGSRVPVFVGLISYSLYLWHWPVYVFARAATVYELTALQTVALLALSAVLAMLSWRYVELPFRGHASAVGRRSLFASAAAAVAVIGVCGAVMWGGDGLPSRYSPHIRSILAEADDAEPRMHHCFGMTVAAVNADRLCRIGAPGKPPDFLLWGDSHADAILPAVSDAAASRGRAGVFAGHGRCPPLIGAWRPDTRECGPLNDAVMRRALRSDIADVILDGIWAKDAGFAPVSVDDDRQVVLQDSQSKEESPAETRAVFARALERTVKTLRAAGKRVTIIAAVPENSRAVPDTLAKMELLGSRRQIGPTLQEFLTRQEFVMALFADLRAKYGVAIYYPHTFLCAGRSCRVELNGRPFYRDAHHLSVFGARQLTPMLIPIFETRAHP